jgi:hypothetical protein
VKKAALDLAEMMSGKAGARTQPLGSAAVRGTANPYDDPLARPDTNLLKGAATGRDRDGKNKKARVVRTRAVAQSP